MNLKNKFVSILGAGESGVQSAIFLRSKGANVFVSELKDAIQFSNAVDQFGRFGITHEFGQHSWPQIEKSDLIIISPGIPPKSLIYKKVIQSKIPVWSEIELAFRFSSAEIIAVTGTSGKTTVTTLIRNVLEAGGRKVISCGNIGNSFIREVERMDSGTVAVIEVSSFQLMHIEKFRPHVGVLLNISDNHLDWHQDLEEYRLAKWQMFKNQTTKDYAILDLNDSDIVRRSSELKSKVIFFDTAKNPNPNFAVVEQVASLYRIPSATVRSTLKAFKGLEHRMEDVGIFCGVKYVNDSKSTTVASLKWAIERTKPPIVLIAGGRYKGGDFQTLRELVKAKVKFLVAIGESRQRITEAFTDLIPVYQAETLDEALRVARGAARPDETILFSPACSSFDMFRNYRERGEQFKDIVKSWQKELVAG